MGGGDGGVCDHRNSRRVGKVVGCWRPVDSDGESGRWVGGSMGDTNLGAVRGSSGSKQEL